MIDGLRAAQEAAAGSPTLVGPGVRTANAMNTVHVMDEEGGERRRHAVIGIFAAGAAMGAVVVTGVLALLAKPTPEPELASSAAVAASARPAATRAAPLATTPDSDLPVGPLVNAERALAARGVEVHTIGSEEARLLRLYQGPQAFRVANVAAGVTAVAPDDIIVGACGANANGSTAEPLDVCVVRDGKLVVARL